jgi:hypothetical protein
MREDTMNMQRPRRGLVAGIMLGLVSAMSFAVGGPAASGTAPAPAAAEAAATPAPADVTTATATTPATVVIDRQAGPTDVLLDINVTAFRPPRRGAVEAVVTFQENKAGGREVDVSSFSIFPAKKFKASKPDDERGFRLDATQALADLGVDNTAVKVKVRLVPLHDGQSAAGAKLTLGKVRFVPRDDGNDNGKDNDK